jgi:hypothetical protein
MAAGDLATTPAEVASLEAVREVTGGRAGGLELHNWRQFAFAEELARRKELEVDRELLMCAALLHDIGLYPGASRGGVYVADGAIFARELLADQGWPAERMDRLANAIELHHELRSQWDKGVEVELIRRSDLIEVSGGLVRFGLDRAFIASVNAEYPRTGFYREIGRLLGHALIERPLTLPRIFLR